MPSAAKIGGNLGMPEVLGRFNFPRLKGFGSISAYVGTKMRKFPLSVLDMPLRVWGSVLVLVFWGGSIICALPECRVPI